MLAAAAALCLAAAPAAAQQTPPPASAPAEEQGRERGNMEGEVWGYLALPILLVLTAILGFALSGGEEEARISP